MSKVNKFQLNVTTNSKLTEEEVETLQANIWSLLVEVRPDLVSECLSTDISYIDIFELEEDTI